MQKPYFFSKSIIPRRGSGDKVDRNLTKKIYYKKKKKNKPTIIMVGVLGLLNGIDSVGNTVRLPQ